MSFILRVFSRSALVSVVALAGLSPLAAKANTIAITNGSFETTTLNASNQVGYKGADTTTTQEVTGWTNTVANGTLGYNFLFQSGSASAYGNSGNLKLWDTSNGGKNTITASPAGGNFMAMDGAYQTSALTQELTGLTIGSQVTVSFYYAGAQQYSFTGQTTEGFRVSLGGESHDTQILTNANHGFTGWQQANLTFTATSASETLSFLALGTPNGVPPFTLLDGVTASDNVGVTPEPSTLALLGTGLLSVCGLARRRFRTA